MVPAVPTDTIERLRALALDGMAVEAAAPILPFRKRRRDDGAPPTIEADAPTFVREPMPHALRAGADLEWRRATHPWVPSLDRLVAHGVTAVTVRGGDVAAVMNNGTQRAQSLPRPWVAVVVAILTGRELPAVRASLRAGTTRFTVETVDG
jgi:hypothetical protein